jgi:hypothetical protein
LRAPAAARAAHGAECFAASPLAPQAREAADTLPQQVSALVAEVEAARARTEAAKQGTPPFSSDFSFASERATHAASASQLPRGAPPAPTPS